MAENKGKMREGIWGSDKAMDVGWMREDKQIE